MIASTQLKRGREVESLKQRKGNDSLRFTVGDISFLVSGNLLPSD
jgi:hypothetical protein